MVDIKYLSETEIFVGENRVLIYDGNIIHVTCIGLQTEEIAQAHLELVMEFFKKYTGFFYFLIDLNKKC
jgi:hypothetical protein